MIDSFEKNPISIHEDSKAAAKAVAAEIADCSSLYQDKRCLQDSEIGCSEH